MTDSLYVFAKIPSDVLAHLESTDFDCSGARATVSPDRRHITLLNLTLPDLPQDRIIAIVRRAMAALPPFTFRVIFDELVRTLKQTLLTATQPLVGLLGAQMQLRAALARHGLHLPDAACPKAHVTLAYGEDRAPHGVWPILPVSWRVEELALVRSHVGQTRHETLTRWHLPEVD